MGERRRGGLIYLPHLQCFNVYNLTLAHKHEESVHKLAEIKVKELANK